jgi:hypothetical protein
MQGLQAIGFRSRHALATTPVIMAKCFRRFCGSTPYVHGCESAVFSCFMSAFIVEVVQENLPVMASLRFLVHVADAQNLNHLVWCLSRVKGGMFCVLI